MSLRFIQNSLIRSFTLILIGIATLPTFGQGRVFQVKADKKPLNELLVELRNEKGLRCSFDHQLLSAYTLTADTSFITPEETLSFLLKNTPIRYKKLGHTYVIFPAEPVAASRPPVFSGRVIDSDTRETLPYSHIRSGEQTTITDQNGNFSMMPQSGEPVALSVSYLGYSVLDTLLPPGENHLLELKPAPIGIRNVVILSDSLRISMPVTTHPGEVRLNPRISAYLPGHGDQSLFNLIRLQPGILAAGEQSNDLIIWGCYEGQSQVLLDGFTLYGLKNFNDQISIVNPLLIKDIRILKGGFEPRYGNRVGGIVDITAFDGSTDRIHGEIIANNLTLNGMISVPVTSRSALIMAFRNTYYNLNKQLNIKLPGRLGILRENPVDLVVEPDYTFRDANLKYSGTTRRGDQYGLHFLYGVDSFSYHLDAPMENIRILDTLQEKNRQQGISGNYQFRWASGQMTTLTASYSASRTDLSNRIKIERKHLPPQQRFAYSSNLIRDFALKLDNRILMGSRHTLEYGSGVNSFGVEYLEESSGSLITGSATTGWLAGLYLQDRVTLSERIMMQFGIRGDYSSAAPKMYLQPRASLEWQISPVFRMKSSVGRYNQFIVKSTLEDDAGNIRYFWALADNSDVPVVTSNHITLGGYLDWKTLQFHAETWFKTYDGITRYQPSANQRDPEILHGESRGAGLDFYLQKQIGPHSGWISYSLSRTIERYPGSLGGRYLRAPQDQTNELKFATLLDFSPLFFSASYVFGSGFPNRTQAQTNPELANYPYSRLDASLTYRVKIKKTTLEAGLSVLNILNTQNIKVSNFVRIPLTSLSAFNVQAEAIPFTPTLFLKFSF